MVITQDDKGPNEKYTSLEVEFLVTALVYEADRDLFILLVAVYY